LRSFAVVVAGATGKQQGIRNIGASFSIKCRSIYNRLFLLQQKGLHKDFLTTTHSHAAVLAASLVLQSCSARTIREADV